MNFINAYLSILKQSKIAQFVQSEFDKACSYFNFLQNIDIDTYQWIYGNTTGFNLIIQNNYQNITIKLTYNKSIIISNIYEITALDNTLNNQIATFIRQFLTNILNINYSEYNISKLDFQKLAVLIK